MQRIRSAKRAAGVALASGLLATAAVLGGAGVANAAGLPQDALVTGIGSGPDATKAELAAIVNVKNQCSSHDYHYYPDGYRKTRHREDGGWDVYIRAYCY